MEPENPILNTFVVAGQTRHLTLVDSPTPKSKPNVPPAIKKLISELGLRFRPTSQADLEAHAASLALLASDLHDMPPHLLEKAIRKHVMESPYLPKAADLVRLAKSFIEQPRAAHGPIGETMAERGNRLCCRDDVRWYDDGTGGAYLGFVA